MPGISRIECWHDQAGEWPVPGKSVNSTDQSPQIPFHAEHFPPPPRRSSCSAMSGHFLSTLDLVHLSCTTQGQIQEEMIMPSSKCQLPLRLSLPITKWSTQVVIAPLLLENNLTTHLCVPTCQTKSCISITTDYPTASILCQKLKTKTRTKH